MVTLSGSPEDWVETDHDRVFYKSPADAWGRGEYLLAECIADYIPGWIVVITMGPYRSHDFSYNLYHDEQWIHLDCYSAGMAPNCIGLPYREQHPVVEHAESLIQNIVDDIRDSQ